MAGTQTEAILNKLSKPELFQLLQNTEANMGTNIATLTAEIKEINNHLYKLEANVAVNVNSRLIAEADLGLLQQRKRSTSCTLEAVNYYHKELHVGCCRSPRSASEQTS